MQTDLNLPIERLTREHLANIKVICFDGDGVTKRKGTEFSFVNGQMVLESFPPEPELKEGLLELSKHFHVSISSGRSLQYLKNIYDEELMGENGSLQGEIGMYLYWKKFQISNFKLKPSQKEKIERIRTELKNLNHPAIKGFEPKEYLITLHCTQSVAEVEEIVKKNDPENELFCWWNEEAYDIGINGINKGTGLKKLVEKLDLKMENVLTVGNGINDENMTDVVGLDISTDPKHLKADFAVWGEEAGGLAVINKILILVKINF